MTEESLNGWVIEGENERPIAFFWEKELAFQYCALCYYEGIEKSFRTRQASFIYFLNSQRTRRTINAQRRIDSQAGADAEQLNVCREQSQEL